MSDLEELLSRLPSIEDSQLLTYEGKAVSRDKAHLHLAVASGVVAIPLSDITEVKPLADHSSNIVSVNVKSTDGIKQIRQVSGLRGGGLGGFGGGGFGYQPSTYSNGHYEDSATVSGGQADATDDTHWILENDDPIY
jgi:hypothetical protein